MDKLRRQLKELYMTCFPEDSESYADFFITNKFDGTNCMTLFEDGRLINMLFLVKKKMYLRGTVFNVPYMTAGGTLPEYRGRGIFTGVMAKAFKNFHDGGVPFTGLMPFDHDFYLKQSFVTHSFYKENKVLKGTKPVKEISFGQINEMAAVYNQFMKDKNGWFYRDFGDFDLRLREIFNEGGKAYGLYDDEVMKGYILTFDDEEIDEYCALSPEVINGFDTRFETVKENVGCQGEQDNMLRVCNNKLLLQSIKYPEEITDVVTICVEDGFFKENCGRYKLSVEGGGAEVADVSSAEYELNVEDFTRLVSGSYEKGRFGERLERLFPAVLNCALDKF